METIYLSLGSNVGDRLSHLRKAVTRLRDDPAIQVLRQSKIYETSPVGPRQRDFLNAVVKTRTPLEPGLLLQRLKKIERALGRRSGPRRGPRPIDLDILIFGRRRLRDPRLTVPHPQLKRRLFVLKPLSDLAPHLRDPATGKTISQLLRKLTRSGQRAKVYRPTH